MDRYFKLAIDLNVLVLEDDGSALASALSVASLALADAGVEVRDMMAGVTLHRVMCERTGGDTRSERDGEGC
eukprot:3092846-Amphidinium_carterae.1